MWKLFDLPRYEQRQLTSPELLLFEHFCRGEDPFRRLLRSQLALSRYQPATIVTEAQCATITPGPVQPADWLPFGDEIRATIAPRSVNHHVRADVLIVGSINCITIGPYPFEKRFEIAPISGLDWGSICHPLLDVNEAWMRSWAEFFGTELDTELVIDTGETRRRRFLTPMPPWSGVLPSELELHRESRPFNDYCDFLQISSGMSFFGVHFAPFHEAFNSPWSPWRITGLIGGRRDAYRLWLQSIDAGAFGEPGFCLRTQREELVWRTDSFSDCLSRLRNDLSTRFLVGTTFGIPVMRAKPRESFWTRIRRLIGG